MSKTLYTNNATTTLAASAVAEATSSLTVATGTGSRFATPSSDNDEWQALTLTDGASIEIVHLTGRTGDVLTVTRGMEGTTALDWSIGAVLEGRITASMMSRLVQMDVAGTCAEDADQYSLLAAPDVNSGTGLSLAEGTVYAGDTVVSQDGLVVGVVAVGGDLPVGYSTTLNSVVGDTATPAGGVVLRLFRRNPYAATALGRSVLVGYQGVAVGASAIAHKNALAVGTNAHALANGGICVGGSSLALAEYGLALGGEAESGGGFSVALGYGAQTNLPYSLVTRAIPTLPPEGSGLASGIRESVSSPVIIGSHHIDLGQVPAWAADTYYRVGQCVRPTTANGLQYVLGTGSATTAIGTEYLSDTNEPEWPLAGENVSVGANEYWIAIDPFAGLSLEIPYDMILFVDEVGFVCETYASVSANPYVSVGTVESPTLLANNVQLSQITAAGMRHTITPTSKIGLTGSLQFKLVTKATGTNSKFHGRFYVRGFVFSKLE